MRAIFKSIKIFAAILFCFGMVTHSQAQTKPGDILKITNTENSYPYWSPDGEKIVFQSNRAGGQSEIYVMNSDGTGLTRLTYSAADDLTPVWSPDGEKIVFQSYRDGNGEIYVMLSDGSRQTNVTHFPGEDMHPKWHPDGRRIIFNSVKGYWNIVDHYSVKMDGIRLMSMGRIKRGCTGCYCPEGALLQALVGHLLVQRDEVVILDMEAGIEHLSRGTTKAVDKLIIVV